MGIRAVLTRVFRRRRQGGSWIARRIACKLQLDQAQETSLNAMEEMLGKMREDAREGLRYQRQALLGLLSKEQLDRNEALRLIRVPVAMVDDSLPAVAERFAAFYNGLTGEQRERLRKWMGRHGRCGHCRHAC